MGKKFILIMLLMAVTLSGCGKKTDKKAADETVIQTEEAIAEETETADEKETGVQVADLSIVKEQYSREGSYDIPYGEESYEYEFSYHVPEIDDDSNDAKMINNEIYDFCKSSIQTVEEIMNGSAEEIYEPNYRDISYKAYINEDILSIVITADAVYSDWIDYYVFNYDVDDKKIVRNADLLDKMGISDDDFVRYARVALTDSLTENLRIFVEGNDNIENDVVENHYYRSMIPGFIYDFVQTINQDNCNTDVPMYLDEDGDLSIIGRIYIEAGPGMYCEDIKLEATDKEPDVSLYLEYAEKYHYPEFEKDCMRLFEEEGYSAQIAAHEDGEVYDENVYIGFDSDDPSIFLYQTYNEDNGDSFAYEGEIKFAGMDEYGIKYEYKLLNRDGADCSFEGLSGIFYLNSFSRYNEETYEYEEGAIYVFLQGHDLMYSDGKLVYLDKSFG